MATLLMLSLSFRGSSANYNVINTQMAIFKCFHTGRTQVKLAALSFQHPSQEILYLSYLVFVTVSNIHGAAIRTCPCTVALTNPYTKKDVHVANKSKSKTEHTGESHKTLYKIKAIFFCFPMYNIYIFLS